MKLLITLLLLSIPTASWAKTSEQDCQPVDYSEQLGPQDDQEDSGWCYAYSVAELFSFHLKEKVSAPVLALDRDTRKQVTPKKTKGGVIYPTFKRAIKDGLCKASEFPFDAGTTLAVYEASPTDFKKRVDTYCKERIYPTHLEIHREESDADMKNVNRILNSKNIFSIYIKSLILTQTDHLGIFKDHVSTVVGRRWNVAKNQCEFKIRNATGTQCEGFHSDLTCEGGSLWLPESDLKRAAGRRLFYVTSK